MISLFGHLLIDFYFIFIFLLRRVRQRVSEWQGGRGRQISALALPLAE